MGNSRVVAIRRAVAVSDRSMVVLPPLELDERDALRGTDPLSEVVLRACFVLLRGFSESERNRMGVVLGTRYGCLETDRVFDRSRREHGGRYASPAAFSRTLPSTVAAEVALKFSLRGPSVVVLGGPASAAVALRRAGAWMEHFDLEYCLAGSVDWTELGGAQAALVLLAREGAGVGNLRVCGGWGVALDSARLLVKWISTGKKVDVGCGVELMGRQ